MKEFTLLIKPTSADCNLRCDYCFYLDKSKLYPDTQIHRMTEKTLEQLISTYMQTDQTQYVFNWQGGEPTLMGFDFFQKTVNMQKKFGKPGSVVGNSIQTNATLITDDLAKLMTEYRFLAGVSLDGPPELHNIYRQNSTGKGSHESVSNGIECLVRNKTEFNVLTLVSAANVYHGKKVFEYLKELNIKYHQYIPCVEFDENGDPLPWSITGSQWGEFLCEIFDEWMRYDPYSTSIRLFDAILIYLTDGHKTLCHMNDNCAQYLVVEYNGDVYPCDFFVKQELKLGNIFDDSWKSIIESQTYKDFGSLKSQLNNECVNCDILNICMGDCLKHRITAARNSADNKSYLCEGWKMFYNHSLPGFKKLSRKIIENRQMISDTQKKSISREYKNIGRNDICPCGSGKKFKKCHGRNSDI